MANANNREFDGGDIAKSAWSQNNASDAISQSAIDAYSSRQYQHDYERKGSRYSTSSELPGFTISGMALDYTPVINNPNGTRCGYETRPEETIDTLRQAGKDAAEARRRIQDMEENNRSAFKLFSGGKDGFLGSGEASLSADEIKSALKNPARVPSGVADALEFLNKNFDELKGSDDVIQMGDLEKWAGKSQELINKSAVNYGEKVLDCAAGERPQHY